MNVIKKAAVSEMRALLVLFLMLGSYAAGTTQTYCFGWLYEITFRNLEDVE